MMRRLAESFFAESPLLLMPILGLVIFFGVFVGAMVLAARIRDEEVDACARLALEGDGPQKSPQEVNRAG